MLTREEILSIFQDTGAMLEGHFLLTSGRHSDRYFQCALVLQHPGHTASLCRELADKFMGGDISAVIGPAMGGVIVSYETARALGVRSLFTERVNGVMTLRRGFSINPGEKVLVVEDVITTGGSVREVVDLVRNCGGEVAGVGVLVDRSSGGGDLGARVKALLAVEAVSYPPPACPLCKKGVPLVKPGSRNI